MTPALSIVVPTANRPGPLAGCLAALARLDPPPGGFEVVVVDDGSAADLGAVCSAASGLDLRLLRRARGGPAAARNTGIAEAVAPLVAFTDDDCRPTPGWATALVGAARVAPGAGLGGPVRNALPANPYSAASQHVHDLVHAHFNRRPGDPRFFASNNLAFPRADLLAVGGFDERFPFAAEDRELCDRWRASGRPLRFVADAVVDHAHPMGLPGFVRQHVAYGRGAARFHAVRAARGSGRLRDDLAFHADPALWRRTLAVRPPRRAARLVALLVVWQAANAAGYVLERVDFRTGR